MFKLFKKKEGVVDLTLLAKRGLIKPEADYKELSGLSPSLSPKANESGLGFLSSLAGAGSDSSESPVTNLNKNKVEDIEFKMDSLSRRVNGILDRLDLAEKKIERMERRGE